MRTRSIARLPRLGATVALVGLVGLAQRAPAAGRLQAETVGNKSPVVAHANALRDKVLTLARDKQLRAEVRASGKGIALGERWVRWSGVLGFWYGRIRQQLVIDSRGARIDGIKYFDRPQFIAPEVQASARLKTRWFQIFRSRLNVSDWAHLSPDGIDQRVAAWRADAEAGLPH